MPDTRQPTAPFEPMLIDGNSVTVQTAGKVLVLPTGNPDILPLHNEYTLNSNRLSVSDSPFGGLKGSGSPDYAVGTISVNSGDGVYLQDVSSTNTTKTLTAGKLKELGLLTVDTQNHCITEEFVIANTSSSNNPTIISDGSNTTGWSIATGTLTSLTSENGRIKVVGKGTGTTGLKIYKNISLTGSSFLRLKIECNVSKNLYINLTQSSNCKEWRGTRFPINVGSETVFVLPILAPQGTTGSNPSLVSGDLNWSNTVTLYIGTDQIDAADITFYIDDIQSDVAKPAYIELQTPDYLADTSAQIYTHNGSTYQLCGTYKLDSSFVSVSGNSLGWVMADGTLLNDIYGSYNGRSIFPKSVANNTVNGSTGTITYSQNAGTKYRIGLRVDLPQSDNGRTAFNQVRLKTVIYYTDIQGNIVSDVSGRGNNLSVIGTVPKSTTGYVFGTNGNYLLSSYPIPELNISSDFEFNMKAMFYSRSGTQRIFGNYISTGSANGVALCIDGSELRWGFWDGSIASYVKGSKILLNDTHLNVWHNIRCGQVSGIPYLFLDSTEGTSASLGNLGTQGLMIGGSATTDRNFAGKISYVKISNSSGTLAEYTLTTLNMGSTTYEFSNDFSASTGLQNMAKPWIALYDPEKLDIDFFLHTYRPRQLKYKRDETGNVHELTLFPGNGNLYHGRIFHCNPALDSNSNLIPDCLEPNVEGSVQKFLQSHGFAEDWYTEYDLSTSAIQTNDFSVTAESLDIIPFAVSEGDSVSNTSNVVLPVAGTISTATGNVSLVDVRGLSTIRVRDTSYTNFGECRVYDGTTRVYDPNWVFSSYCDITNGLYTIRIVSGGTSFKKYAYGESSNTDMCYFGGATITSWTINILSVDKIVVTVTMNDASTRTLTIIRGQYGAMVNFPRYVYLKTVSAPNPRIICNLESVLRDRLVTTGYSMSVNTYNKSVMFGIDPTLQHIPMLALTRAGASVYIDNNMQSLPFYPSFIGAIPFDCSKLFFEAESCNVYNTVDYTGTDASPFSGITGKTITQKDGYVMKMGIVIGVDIPIGTYTLYCRTKENGSVENDNYKIYVRNENTLDYYAYGITYTPTASFSYKSTSFTIPASAFGDTLRFYISQNADTGVISCDVDYFLLVPTSLIEKHAMRALYNLSPFTKQIKSSKR